MKAKFVHIILLLFSIIIGIIFRIDFYNIYSLNSDMIEHYYHMRKYYDNNIFPATSALLEGSSFIANYYDSNSDVYKDTAKVPGGFFYIEYIFYYFLSSLFVEGGSLYISRIFYSISMSIFCFIFLFWIYKRFGLEILSIITSLIFVNITFFTVNSKFYNPHTAFILSFIFIPIMLDYACEQKYKNICAVLLFPILALSAQGHFAIFFTIVPTLIVYMIIRFNNTKYYIRFLLIGLFISFLLYTPYIISEFNNGFENFKHALALRNRVSPIVQPPQIWSILFFPTNEPNANYGNKILSIFYTWFKNGALLKVSFVFYIISILVGIGSFILLVYDFFKNKIKSNIFRESALIYIIYIIVTVLLFMLFNLGSARARYFLIVFPLTFIPIIYLIERIKNKKLLFNFFIIFAFLNPLAIYVEFKDYFYKNDDSSGWNFMIPHIEAIIDDSPDMNFDLSTNFYQPYVLLKIENKNFKINTNANIKYNMIYSVDKNNINTNYEIIYSNKQYITYKEYKN